MRVISKFLEVTGAIYPKNHPKQICGYCLTHQTRKYFLLKLIFFNSAQLQIRKQLQNNSVNGAILITINHVINTIMGGDFNSQLKTWDLCEVPTHLTLRSFPLFEFHDA